MIGSQHTKEIINMFHFYIHLINFAVWISYRSAFWLRQRGFNFNSVGEVNWIGMKTKPIYYFLICEILSKTIDEPDVVYICLLMIRNLRPLMAALAPFQKSRSTSSLVVDAACRQLCFARTHQLASHNAGSSASERYGMRVLSLLFIPVVKYADLLWRKR
jgi:hypothetical protein